MSNSVENTTDAVIDVNVTTLVPTTTLLRQIIKATTEAARIVTSETVPSTTVLSAPTTIRATTMTPTDSQSTWETANTNRSIPETTTKMCSTTTTEVPFDEFGPPEGVEYIFVPLGVMIFVIILSAVVLIVSRRRKLERLRHRLVPLYNFDPGEEGEDDWETELLDEGFSNRQRRQGYQSMDSEENTELFGPH